MKVILKALFYNLFAPGARFIMKNAIGSKPIAGSQKKLYYEKSQHLGFLFQKQINYEPEFRERILQYIMTGDLVFEIGSNIGQYSLMIAERIGDTGKLICIEPDSNNFSFLSFNVLKNQCKNVELINVAVSNKAGTAVFYKDTVTGGRRGSLWKEYVGNYREGQTEEIKTITLQDLITLYGRPDFVKIDVEGAEQLIFEKTGSITEKTKYFIEVRKETKSAIFQVFHVRGFHVYVLEEGMRETQTAEDIPDFSNLLITTENLH